MSRIPTAGDGGEDDCIVSVKILDSCEWIEEGMVSVKISVRDKHITCFALRSH